MLCLWLRAFLVSGGCSIVRKVISTAIIRTTPTEGTYRPKCDPTELGALIIPNLMLLGPGHL